MTQRQNGLQQFSNQTCWWYLKDLRAQTISDHLWSIIAMSWLNLFSFWSPPIFWVLSDQVLSIFDQDVRWCKSIDKATARRQCRASWLAADLQRCWLTVASSKRCLGNGGFGAKVRESNVNDSNTQQSKRRFQRKTQVVWRSKMAVSLGWQARLMRRVVLLDDRRKPVSLERYTYQQVNAWNLCVELGLYPCYTMLYHFYYFTNGFWWSCMKIRGIDRYAGPNTSMWLDSVICKTHLPSKKVYLNIS